MSWHCLSASVSFIEPEITLEKSWVQRLPTSWNWGTPTYCTPGRPGRFEVPGLAIGAAAMDFRVSSANAEAACSYCGILYVELRVPGGIAAQPPSIRVPASLMYCGPVANEMYFHAESALLEVFGIASAHDHSQPEAGVSLTGASA